MNKPVSTRSRILAALDVTLEDIPEHRLVDILLDSYRAKVREVAELRQENAVERESIEAARQQFIEETREMRCDPFYCANGAELTFVDNSDCFVVRAFGGKVQLFKRKDGVDYVLRQISSETISGLSK